jgi:5-methylcytosine-specific restriction enzyme A
MARAHRVPLVCATCRETILIKPSRLPVARFCSQKCIRKTDEQKQKHSRSGIGHYHSPETRLLLSLSHRGKIISPEQRQKISEALTGDKNHRWQGGPRTPLAKRKNSFYQRMRSYRKKNAIGRHTLQQWIFLKIINAYLCNHCGDCEPNIHLTEDHIIPLSKGGSNDISNIQPLCMRCNSIKQNRDYDPSR